jgi:hypothetical protein
LWKAQNKAEKEHAEQCSSEAREVRGKKREIDKVEKVNNKKTPKF